MIALVVYEFDFNVCSDYNSASIDADTSIVAVYGFDSKDEAKEYLPELRKAHPNAQWTCKQLDEPLRERKERDLYEKRMRGDWS